MLLGGMNVVGIYLWASEATFKATSPAVLSQVYFFSPNFCFIYSKLPLERRNFAFSAFHLLI